jgi:hypothetical protein
MRRAIFIKKLDDWLGEALLYRLSPPPVYSGKRQRYYVAVSAVDLNKIYEEAGILSHIPDDMLEETYIFHTTRLGKVVEWGELRGSFKGKRDHKEALFRAGYTPD